MKLTTKALQNLGFTHKRYASSQVSDFELKLPRRVVLRIRREDGKPYQITICTLGPHKYKTLAIETVDELLKCLFEHARCVGYEEHLEITRDYFSLLESAKKELT